MTTLNHWQGYLFEGIKPGTDGSIAADVVAQAEAITAEDALRRGGLDWQVQKTPLVAVIDGDQREVPGRFAITRTDTGAVVGDVGRHYKMIQNSTAVDFTDAVRAAAHELGVLTGYVGAGPSQGGSRASLMLTMGDPIGVGKDSAEAIVPMLYAEWSHNGSVKYKLRFVTPRWACMNGMWVFTGSLLDDYEVKHTLHNELQLLEAQAIVRAGVQHFADVGTLSNALAAHKLTKPQGVKLIRAIYPGPEDPAAHAKAQAIAERVQQEILATWQGSETLGNLRNTAYGLWQAAVEYDDWQGRIREVNGRTESELRFERAVSASPLKTRALAVIREAVAA